MCVRLLTVFLFLNCCFELIVNVSIYQKTSQKTIDATKCGYESCPAVKTNMLNVHLVPHTHDDVGWLKTVDQYYYGSRSRIQKAGVQYILDSVVQSLLSDPEKRFIYVESAFFFKWWKDQKPELREQVRQLVNEGRLEFIGGAWSMNDEATTHYQSIIDQFAWGLKRLTDEFGACGRPRIGWQIDTFGHSREMASLFAQMGFDGLFFGRLDYQDKDVRLISKTPEMVWRASANLDNLQLFTGALYNQYQAPPGFCFDILCSDEPIIDDHRSSDYNVEKRVDEFFNFLKRMNQSYSTNHLLLTMGEDFNYQSADMWYKNLDKLIKYSNARQENGSNINLIYSTPSCYLKALYDTGISWPTKEDDFFPYSSDPHAFWTGYFTSRPNLKRYERVGNHFLQVCKRLTAIAPKLYPELAPHLNYMREVMGVLQHHDAVTGTEKQAVAEDYAKQLYKGIAACSSNTQTILNHLILQEHKWRYGDDANYNNENRTIMFDFKSCPLLNISSCAISERSETFIVTLYNSLAHEIDEYIRVPVPDIGYEVYDNHGKKLSTQLVPIPESVLQLKFRKSEAKYDLVFYATQLPALGYRSYYIKTVPTDNMAPVPEPTYTSSYTNIYNKNMWLAFDTNGFLTSVTSNGKTILLSQDMLYYEGATGNNLEFNNRSSGAYIFRPFENKVTAITNQAKLTTYVGNLVNEVHQVYNDWISQVIRMYSESNYIEFEWMVGPIPINDFKGKEIITRYSTNIQSHGVFYTDSNGRETLVRARDHRDTWKLKLYEPISGNYYPVTTKIAIEDTELRMAVLVDRAQGGSSLSDGNLELMLHRRLLEDDAFGVDEPLNETAFDDGVVARGKHYLFIGPLKNTTMPSQQRFSERQTQLRTTLPIWKFFSATNLELKDWLNYHNELSSIFENLPVNVHLLTLEPWHDNEWLVRFEHILEKDDNAEYSQIAKFDLSKVFANVKIERVRETTLDGNAWLDEINQLKFKKHSARDAYEEYGIFPKAVNGVHLQKAGKPLLNTAFSKEVLTDFNLGAENNRLKREDEQVIPRHLNKERIQKLDNIRLNGIEGNKLYPSASDYQNEFIIVLRPMEIRTFIVYLSD